MPEVERHDHFGIRVYALFMVVAMTVSVTVSLVLGLRERPVRVELRCSAFVEPPRGCRP